MKKEQNKTPLANMSHIDKICAIEVMNDYYQDTFVIILRAFVNVESHETVLPVIKDIYEEGVEMCYCTTSDRPNKIKIPDDLLNDPQAKMKFIPFITQKDDIYERLRDLSDGAYKKLNIVIPKPSLNTQSFLVKGWEHITANMIRITISSTSPLPTDKAGYSFHLLSERFTNNKTSTIETATADGDIEKRYYTLRQRPLHTNLIDGEYIGEIDIYDHGDTTGVTWTKSLKSGDYIISRTNYYDPLSQFVSGQGLLVCDETSVSTVAVALEQWTNPVLPLVIYITRDARDHAYFDDLALPKVCDNLDINYLTAKSEDEIGNQVIEVINQSGLKIDATWGAIGGKEAKKIYHFLRKQFGIKGKQNRMRAYWH